MQKLLNQLSELFSDPKRFHYGEITPFYHLQLSQVPVIQEELPKEGDYLRPQLFLKQVSGKVHLYDGILDLEHFFHFANRIKAPKLVPRDFEQAKDFLDFE